LVKTYGYDQEMPMPEDLRRFGNFEKSIMAIRLIVYSFCPKIPSYSCGIMELWNCQKAQCILQV
jgi:hypothetical protein